MKLVLLAVVCLAVAVCASKFSEEHYQNEFTQWQRTHNKAFDSKEFHGRYANFKNMYDYVHDHNSKNHSWTAGLNHFSHLTSAEFKTLYLSDLSNYKLDRSNEFTGEGHTSRWQGTVDWRTRGKVNPIRNQGQCGSCWAFASVAATEGAWAVARGSLPSPLSEQQLLDCTQYTCNGGWPSDAMNYIKGAGGINRNSDYPYQTARGSCRANSNLYAATVSGVVAVATNEGALQSAVDGRPVVICLDAGRPSFQSYRSGVYDDTTCTTTINHAVTAIGYGSDDGNYWIVKNSWDTWWGEAGYFRIRKGVNRCGLQGYSSYPTSTGTGNRV